MQLARDAVDFQPCAEEQCVQIRYTQRGIPVRGYWLVGLRSTLDSDDPSARDASVLVDVQTGELSRP